jgi:hypothetical protein
LSAVIFSVAVHHLFWRERIEYPGG